MGGSVRTLPWSNLHPTQLQDFWRNTKGHRLGMDILNSAEGESLKSFFLDLASYERKSIIARYGTWAAGLADRDYGHTERERSARTVFVTFSTL
jgi:hypothetical protein